jgi:hypothetical protein
MESVFDVIHAHGSHRGSMFFGCYPDKYKHSCNCEECSYAPWKERHVVDIEGG